MIVDNSQTKTYILNETFRESILSIINGDNLTLSFLKRKPEISKLKKFVEFNPEQPAMTCHEKWDQLTQFIISIDDTQSR